MLCLIQYCFVLFDIVLPCQLWSPLACTCLVSSVAMYCVVLDCIDSLCLFVFAGLSLSLIIALSALCYFPFFNSSKSSLITLVALFSLARLLLPLPWLLSLPCASGASLRFRSAFSISALSVRPSVRASGGLRPLRFSMFVSLADLHEHRHRHIPAKGIVENLTTF